MAVASATVTGRSGISSLLTTVPIASIKEIRFDFLRNVATVFWVDTVSGPRTVELDLGVTTGLTDTVTSFVHALTFTGS